MHTSAGFRQVAERKLKQLRDYVVPGLGRLGDHIAIHSNASGYFDAEVYSKLVLEGVIVPYAREVGRSCQTSMAQRILATVMQTQT